MDELPTDGDAIPRLPLVAEDDRRLVGHVLCSRATVDGEPVALALGPLVVLPEAQRCSIGSVLVEAVIAEADRMGERVLVLLGHPDYYPRFGFEPAEDLGITPPVSGAFRYAAFERLGD